MRRAVCESAVLCAAMLPAARLTATGLPRGGGEYEVVRNAVMTESGGLLMLEGGGSMALERVAVMRAGSNRAERANVGTERTERTGRTGNTGRAGKAGTDGYGL